jgi:hypothetical protein
MIAACRQALAWHDEYPAAREHSTGWMVRFARQVTRDSSPYIPRPATAARVRDWFTEHESYRDTEGFFTTDAATGEPTSYRVAWQMLGGDSGREWARKHADTDEEGASVSDGLIELDDAATAREAAELAARAVLANGIGTAPMDPAHWADVGAFAEFEGRRPEWAGVLALEGIPTSDGRMITEGGLTWRGLPITLQDQLASQPGHDGAVAAGPITNIFRDGQQIRGEGFFDTGDDGQNARRRMAEGTKQGVSVDLTEVVLDLPEDPEDILDILFGDGLLIILSARIGAATLVSIPAFEGARLQIVGDMEDVEPAALVASGGAMPEGFTMQLVFPIDTDFFSFTANPDTPEQETIEIVTWSPISMYPEGARPAEDDPEADRMGLLEVDVQDPTPDHSISGFTGLGSETYTMQTTVEVPIEIEFALNAAGTALEGTPVLAEGWSPSQVFTPERMAELWFGQVDRLMIPETMTSTGTSGDDIEREILDHMAEPLVASGGLAPPPDWFARGEYTQPVPFTIEDPDELGMRQIHGHIARWGSCHIGFSGRCVDVPRGLDYSSFQGDQVPGVVVCADGSRVKAGPIVMDTVHPSLRAKASDAAAHYADTGSLVAQVRCYEDQYGLQIRGWVMPGVDDAQVARLNAADLSPDWRPRANANGGRGVVAVLAVPVSGFNLGLVASGGTAGREAEGQLLDDIAIVGTNWTPRLTELARRKAAALERFRLPVPSDIAALAEATEDPALTARKTAVLARLAGRSCGCGGSCCTD